MVTVRLLPELSVWLDTVKDKTARGAIVSAIKKLRYGLGDTKALSGGLFECRIHVGAGWRLYFVRNGAEIIILLVGGKKGTQRSDIQAAKHLAKKLVLPQGGKP